MSRFRPGLIAVLLVVLVGGSGCTEVLSDAYAPECEGEAGESSLILMAQSVPSASLVPCIEDYPVGWEYTGSEIRSGRSDIRFDHDRAGPGFLVCAVGRRVDLDRLLDWCDRRAKAGRVKRGRATQAAIRSPASKSRRSRASAGAAAPTSLLK